MARELERELLDEIPLARAMALTVAGYDGATLALAVPLGPNGNDKGCAFGGSLASLMTLAGWGLVHLALKARGHAADIYVQDSTIHYLAPVWQDFGAPFYVTTRTFVRGELTIAAGAEVEFAQDASLIVAAEGSLRAEGTAGSPIVFRGGEDLPGYWKGIEIGTVSAGNVLSNVLFRNAGSEAWFGGPNSTGTLHVSSTGLVALANVLFEQSGGYAVVVQHGGRIRCTAVNHGGFRFFAAAANAAVPTCPGGTP